MGKIPNQKFDQRTDEELMTLYKQGEYRAFEILYRRHASKVFVYLKRRVSVGIAQDLTQEIFLKIHKGRYQYLEQYPFLPWLFTISRNALYDYFKSMKTTESFGFDQPHLPGPPASDLDLVEALKGLPESQRRAIELRYLEDWSFEKIAKDIKTSPENVRQLISRGLKKVRNVFGGSQ